MVELAELGIPSSRQPNEKTYKKVTRLCRLIEKYILKDSFEIVGAENLEEDYYQMFLCDHKFNTVDPVFVQTAVVLASGNDKPIPAPAHKVYVEHKILGRIMIPLFSYPIYGKDDGFTKKEKSMQYSVDSFLKQERILVFPEGRISHDGKLARGKIGSAEIAWRAYHFIQGDESLRKKKKGLKIIPVEISYDSIAGIPLKDVDKTTIRFGESLDFKEEVIDKFHSFKNILRNKEKLKKKLKIKFMEKVMDRIGSLNTINMDNIASRAIYNLASKGESSIYKNRLERQVLGYVSSLKESENLYLSDYLKDENSAKEAFHQFLKRCKKKKAITNCEPNVEFNLEYILSEPEFKHVRSENSILYNYNLLEHSEEFKNILKS